MSISLPSPPRQAAVVTAGFLDLPPDLRNVVYEQVLIFKHGSSIATRTIGIHCMPALLRTCSQIKEEASAICYSQNKFTAISKKGVYAWLDNIGPANCAHIRSLNLWWLDLKAYRQSKREWKAITDGVDPSSVLPDRQEFVSGKMVRLAEENFKALLAKGLTAAALAFCDR